MKSYSKHKTIFPAMKNGGVRFPSIHVAMQGVSGRPYRKDFSLNLDKDNNMATAEQNLELLRKILDGIRDGDLNDVMSQNGFEVSKSTDKSTEWVLKEPDK